MEPVAPEDAMKPDDVLDTPEEESAELQAPRELISEEPINFSEETRQLLEAKGFTIYDLEGKTVEELSQTLGAEWVNMHESRSLHEKERSFRGQVAFKSGEDGAKSLGAEFLNPGQAQDLLIGYDEVVSEKIPGARAVMASAGTWLGVIAKHRETTAGQENYLFSEPVFGDRVWVRTSTESNNGWNKLAVGLGNNEKSIQLMSIPAQPEHFTKPQGTYSLIVPQAGVAS